MFRSGSCLSSPCSKYAFETIYRPGVFLGYSHLGGGLATFLEKSEIGVQRFEADQEGIDYLKNEFLDEAKQYVYFRKGRWSGFEASLEHVEKWVQNHPQCQLTSKSMKLGSDEAIGNVGNAASTTRETVRELLRNYLEKADELGQAITFRAIVVRGVLTAAQISAWENISDLKGSIMTIPEAEEGYFRYLVNEQRFCIFCRVNANLLQGLIGHDTWMIQLLKNQFELEFYAAAIKYGRS